MLTIAWANAFDVVSFGMGMVFVLLILLVVVLVFFSKSFAPKVRLPKTIAETAKDNTDTKINKAGKPAEKEYVEGHLPADYSAAIAMAIHLYYAEVHDEESNVVTIKTVERRYSPWSSKIYGLNNLVR